MTLGKKRLRIITTVIQAHSSLCCQAFNYVHIYTCIWLFVKYYEQVEFTPGMQELLKKTHKSIRLNRLRLKFLKKYIKCHMICIK